MRVSAKAEYACVAMLELAAHHQGTQPVRVKTIADAHGIPQGFLVQILLQLKGAGLVMSTRGAAGGYQLARPPEEISLAEVIQTIDGATPEHAASTASPESSAVRTVWAVWKELQAEEQRILAELTLAELVRRSQQMGALSYQI